MKQGHFIGIYVIIYLFCFLLLFIEQKKYDDVLEQKEKMEDSLKMAVEETAWKLTSVVKEPAQEKKNIIEKEFFEYLYISLGLLQEVEEQKKLNMYCPMLLLVEEEGAFFFYMKEINENGIKKLVHTWSEQISFPFAEDTTKAEKKAIISNVIEEYASDIISNHNYIAQQNGLNYSFYVPKFLQNSSEDLNFPMLFVVFQGWPLNASGEIMYENCIDIAGYIQEVKKYIVELPKNLEQTCAYYHEIDCNYIGIYNGRVLDKEVSKEQAIYTYGAYACEHCVK